VFHTWRGRFRRAMSCCSPRRSFVGEKGFGVLCLAQMPVVRGRAVPFRRAHVFGAFGLDGKKTDGKSDVPVTHGTEFHVISYCSTRDSLRSSHGVNVTDSSDELFE